jgi:hypothetical protein
MSRALAILAAAAVLMSASQAGAVACRDGAGKFIACPVAKTTAKAAPCRDSSGKFTKCLTSKASASAAPLAAKTVKK